MDLSFQKFMQNVKDFQKILLDIQEVTTNKEDFERIAAPTIRIFRTFAENVLKHYYPVVERNGEHITIVWYQDARLRGRAKYGY